ncbi:Bax inhibitor-1/YccA family protein [Anaplasma capra]|uniref:Bax inhibitor-1/YccA family protein n=1 Tax=Anaplasma capra TaxID=1562740 RepID=UPI0021D5EA63|nr:Bax inhibitor-1/YccA family protein [Anaplasma capra]MCU7611173.1 Bax inhibitor-1/YccA family protein [Anaplasma capra]MCU7612323.1 Bax inhibitor-1/YccA family protein [Anaplasma capra]
MNDYSAQFQGAYYCAGLRSYLVKVYNYMAAALGLTGAVALVASFSHGLMNVLYGTPLHWVVSLAPIVMVFFLSSRVHSMSMRSVMFAFFGFAAMMGLSLSYVFMVYTAHSIARVFFISSAMFGVMALYGNTTKRDLSKFGAFLIMGVVGLLIASVVNIFVASGPLHFAISLVAVVVFTAMTAFDAQRIRDMYYRLSDGSEVTSSKMAVMGATSLYFNYINIFLSLLHLVGDRR